jgi:benzoyl-CoA reductase/2-hydroxyglutaryl-CoA dehydratase subunit BcrC/BadD/HgdB
MYQQILIDDLRILAERAGLNLSEDELRRLLAGVNRSKQQAAELRELFASTDEPASIFDLTGERKIK